MSPCGIVLLGEHADVERIAVADDAGPAGALAAELGRRARRSSVCGMKP